MAYAKQTENSAAHTQKTVGIRLEAALTFSTNEDYLKKTKLVLETTSTMMIRLRE